MHTKFTAHVSTANRLYQKGQLQESLSYYQQALLLRPHSPNVIYNLGIVYRDLRLWEESKTQFETLLQLKPHAARAHNNLGIVLQNLKRYEEAVLCYRRAIEYRYKLADPHFNLGLLLLRLGQYEEGWAESEWRWKTKQFVPLKSPKPRWDGKPLKGTLLLHTEQGAGDAMQFIRFLPQAAQRCDRIMLVCSKNLHSLFESVEGVNDIRQAGEIPLGDFDAYIPLMSLPYLLDITLDKVLTESSYLIAPKRTIALPKPTMNDGGFKIGIIWAGSPTHVNDQQRSCPVTEFLPLLQVPGTTFYSLQVGEKADQLQQLNQSPRPIINLEVLQTEFGDAAVLIQQLDLVITVDTAILHLAGAMGKPVWGLLAEQSDWRWLIDREDSPWYPSVRLFRQQGGGWTSVFECVREALVKLIVDS